MNSTHFDNLMSGWLDGSLSAAEIAAFDAELRASDSARQQFWQVSSLHGLAYELAQRQQLHQAVEAATTVARVPSRSIWQRVTSRQSLLALAACMLLVGYFASMAGLLFWDRLAKDNREVAESKTPENATTFATLAYADNARWIANDPQDPADRQAARLQVTSGIAKLQFAQGTTVVVEGPAEFAALSANHGFLRHGKLVAKVPPQSVGFTIDTPQVSVVDLGTEFAIAVGESGVTDVQVSQGKVELHAEPSAGDTPSPVIVTLTAGEARSIESNASGQRAIHVVEYQPKRFANLTGKFSHQLPVYGAGASSEYVRREAHHLIDGSGLTKDGHANHPQDTMWASGGHASSVKNEFVLFDLGRLSQITSMKVWNYNEIGYDLYRIRGIKRGDVYVSTTGKSNPLATPAEWKLVAKGHEFTPGNGTPEYNSPDEIPLNDVECRYVAIVVDEPFGVEPVETQTGKQYVGLSEVQFFGRRISIPRHAVK